MERVSGLEGRLPATRLVEAGRGQGRLGPVLDARRNDGKWGKRVKRFEGSNRNRRCGQCDGRERSHTKGLSGAREA